MLDASANSYFEVAVTVVVLAIYMCCVSRDCLWCRDLNKLREIMRASTEARAEMETEMLHQGA